MNSGWTFIINYFQIYIKILKSLLSTEKKFISHLRNPDIPAGNYIFKIYTKPSGVGSLLGIPAAGPRIFPIENSDFRDGISDF